MVEFPRLAIIVFTWIVASATLSWQDVMKISALAVEASEQPSLILMDLSQADSVQFNPHGDLIFRATGATSCLDCHRMGKDGEVSAQTQDNKLVRSLKAKAKGIHGPGRFTDCFRCHADGDKGVEKYRKQ